MRKRDLFKRLILLAIVLYIFLLSIKLMSGSFILFGAGLTESLLNITSNPFVGLFIGILATSIVQSSSVTTSIIVGLTATGSITVGSAVFMIMGANIGTSITNTIVSLGHIKNGDEFKKAFQIATVHDIFNFMVVIILFPLELLFQPIQKTSSYLVKFFLGSNLGLEFNSPLNLILNPISKQLQNLLQNNAIFVLILSFILLFISLRYIVKIMKPLAKTEFKHIIDHHIFRKPYRAFGFGIFLTVLVQSSSVSTSLIVPIVATGIINLDRAFPYILGTNIGTTITALLASIVTGSPAAVTVALEHVLFNLFGSIFVYPIKKIPIKLSRKLSNMTVKTKAFPIMYIVSLFYLIPALIIFIFA